MFYERFWRRMGFRSKYYRALLESFVFALIGILLFYLMPYAESPFHILISWIYKLLKAHISIYMVGFYIRLVHLTVSVIVLWYPIKVIMSNIMLVIIPHIKNIFSDEFYDAEMEYDFDDEDEGQL